MKQVTRIAEIELGEVLEDFTDVKVGERLSSVKNECIVIVSEKVTYNIIKVTCLYSKDTWIKEGQSFSITISKYRRINNLSLRTENV